MSTVTIQTHAAQSAIRVALSQAAASHFDKYIRERNPLDLQPLREEMALLTGLGPTEAAFAKELAYVVGRHEQQVSEAQTLKAAHPEYFPALDTVAKIGDPRVQREALQDLAKGLLRNYLAKEPDFGLLNSIRDALVVGTPTERALLFEVDLLASQQTMASLRDASRRW